MIRDVRVVRVHAETFERVQIVLEIETEHRQAGVVREAVSRALPEALGAVREQLIGMMRSVACPSCRMGGGEHKLSCANRPRRQVVLPACGTEVDDASMLAPHDGTGAVE